MHKPDENKLQHKYIVAHQPLAMIKAYTGSQRA